MNEGQRNMAALRSRIVTRIEDLDARAWDSVVSKAGMRHEAIRAMSEVSVSCDSVYALVSDASGPCAAISARPHTESAVMRRVLHVTPHLGRYGGIQLRSGLALDAVLPRLVPTLARMARRRRCAAFSVSAEESERAVFERHGFAYFGAPASTRSDLSEFASYEALLARLPRNGHELRRARRRSEQHGVRFEVTSPPRAATGELFALLTETYAFHALSVPFTPGFFERVWAADFAEHHLFCAYLGERLIAAVWCFRDRDVLTASLAAIHYELARPSYAYFTLMDDIVRFALSRGIRTIEWGISNDAIKSRYGGVPIRGFAAVRLALPLPSPLWRGVRAILGSRAVARALGQLDGDAVEEPRSTKVSAP